MTNNNSTTHRATTNVMINIYSNNDQINSAPDQLERFLSRYIPPNHFLKFGRLQDLDFSSFDFYQSFIFKLG
jgi:hypothetical protein